MMMTMMMTKRWWWQDTYNNNDDNDYNEIDNDYNDNADDDNNDNNNDDDNVLQPPVPAKVWSVKVCIQPGEEKVQILTVVSPLVVARVEPLQNIINALSDWLIEHFYSAHIHSIECSWHSADVLACSRKVSHPEMRLVSAAIGTSFHIPSHTNLKILVPDRARTPNLSHWRRTRYHCACHHPHKGTKHMQLLWKNAQ
jgi:hypothetical protein